MNEINLTIAKQITKYREMAGLKKNELANLLQVAPSTVSGWERGEYAPGSDTLVKLCELFEVTLDEIFGQQKKTAPNNGNGLSALDRQLIDYLPQVTEDQKRLLIAQIKTLLGD